MAAEISAQVSAATRRRWDQHYSDPVLPWDTRITPPEVVAFWRSRRLPARGLALDLGCGPGTNVRFLARLGMRAIGVDIAGAALFSATDRLYGLEPHLAARATFICGDVCLLPFSGIGAVYVLDIGCLHSLPPELRYAYAAGVAANLAIGGFYQLFAFDRPPSPKASGPTGVAPGEVVHLFSPALTVLDETVAEPEHSPCRWYLLHRP